MTRLLDLIADRRIVFGLFGAISGLALKYTGVIDGDWLLIDLGLFVTGALAVHVFAPPVPEALRAVPVADLPADLRRLAIRLMPQLPPAAWVHLTQILSAAAAIEPKLRTIDPANPSVITVRQIMADYIPTTLNTYAALPTQLRKTTALGERSADEQLTAQLALLKTQMNGIVETLSRGDLVALEAQGRFLEQKFSAPELFAVARESSLPDDEASSSKSPA